MIVSLCKGRGSNHQTLMTRKGRLVLMRRTASLFFSFHASERNPLKSRNHVHVVLPPALLKACTLPVPQALWYLHVTFSWLGLTWQLSCAVHCALYLSQYRAYLQNARLEAPYLWVTMRLGVSFGT